MINKLEYYYNVIKNIFTLMILIYDYILDIQNKKKKNLLTVLSKANLYTRTAIFRIFNDFIIDPKTKEPLVSKKKLAEFKVLIID